VFFKCMLSDAVRLRQDVHEARSASQRGMPAVSFRPTVVLISLGLPTAHRGQLNGYATLLRGHELVAPCKGRARRRRLLVRSNAAWRGERCLDLAHAQVWMAVDPGSLCLEAKAVPQRSAHRPAIPISPRSVHRCCPVTSPLLSSPYFARLFPSTVSIAQSNSS
jgi:hypothetical protein